MTFADKSFNERFMQMGDEAETQFERAALIADARVSRLGFNRPNFKNFKKLKKVVRHTPDYVMEFEKEFYYVECKGTGHRITLKEETIESMEFWNEILPVLYFVYNSVENGFVLISHESFVNLALSQGTMKQFESDKKVYYELPRTALPFSKEFYYGKEDHKG